MDAYFLINQSWTVDTLAVELYDVVDRATALVDESRRDSAAAALRDANPGLPVDETPFDGTDLAFVWVPLLARSPLRLLDDPSGIRADLEARGLRNVHDLVRQRETWLVTDMATDGWSSADVLRARALARLMNVRGVSRDLALELHDGSTTDVIRTPTQLRDMDQLALKLRIVATSPPTEVLALRPWFRLKRQVSTQVRRRRKIEPMQRPIPYSAKAARVEQEFWATAARDPARTVVERTSARTCADLFELQALMISAFDNQRGGLPSTTQQAHHRLLRKFATHAQAEGLIGPTSTQRNGISLANLLRLVSRWMLRIERDDVDLARRRLRQPSQDPGQGVLGITLSDLTSTARSTVVGDLSAVRLRQAGRGAVDVVLREMSETTLSGLPTAARTDMTSTTAAARTVDLPDIDRVHLRKNLAAMTFGTLQTDLPDAFAALGDALPLADLADAVSTSLGSAWDVGSNALKSRLGETLLDSMTPFERYVCIRPSFRPTLPLCVPLSSQLVPRYLADVLRALDALGDGRVYWYTAEDFADPVRFAFVLPQLYVRQIPRALVLATNGAEAYPESASLISATGSSMYSSDGDAEFGLDELEYQLSSSEEQLTVLLESLRLQNRGADLEYTRGRNTTAAAQYAAVLAEAYTYTDFANLIASLDAADDFLHIAIAESSSGTGTNVPSMLAMATLEPLDDIVSPLFGSIVIESSTPSVTVRSVVTGSKAISYYDPLITLDAGGSIPRASGGGFPAQDDEDEEWDPRELTDNLPSYPISGGGDPTPEIPGQQQETSTVVYSNDEVATGIEAEILHAYTYQQQALAGLNFLGFDPNMVPAWRFDWLLSQARYYCERADGMQQRALGLLGSAEATYKEEYAAETSALVAGAGVEVANAQKSMAWAQVDSAQVTLDAAENTYDRAKSSKVWEIVGAAVIGAAAVVAAPFTGGASVVAVVALSASAVSSTALAANRSSNAVKGASDQVDIAEAGLEVAEAQLAVSQQLLDLAVLEATRAEGYLDLLATLTLNSSAYYVMQDHIGKISTSYLRMANRMAWLAQQALQWESRKRTSYILQSYIDDEDLNSRFGGGATLLSHIDAMEHDRIVATTDRTQVLQTTFSLLGHNPAALAALRALGGTFFQVDQKTLDLRFPGLFLHSLKSIEVEFVGLFPATGVQAILRSCNNARVRVPNDLAYVNWFGLDPVPYEDWAYPATTYVYAQDTTDAAGFVMKPLLGSGFSKILSEYRRTESGAIVSLPEGETDQLENVPVEVMWSLELPRASNAFPLENIVDVRFTLYFTAKHSENLAARQRAQLEADPAQSGGVLFAATVQAASSFAAFVATPLDRTRRDVRILSFPLSARDFPANTRDRVLENFHFALVGLSGDNMKVRLASTVFPITERQHTSWGDGNLPAGIHESVPDGMLFSAVGDTDVLLDLDPGSPETVAHTSWAGTWPALDALVAAVDDRADPANLDAFLGTWALKVLPEHNTDRLVLDDDGEPAESAGTELRLASGTSSVVHETGSWLHVAVEATVQLQEDRTLGFVVRDDATGTGTDRVVATLHLDAGVLTVTVTCGAVSGVRSASVGVHDEWYKVRLEVVGTSATLLLDGVPVPLLVGTALVPALTLAYVSPAKPGPGTVRVTGAGVGSPLRICDLTVTRLRYDGTPLEVVVDERFADLDAWTATAATVHSVTLHALDLSFLREVLFQVDFTSVIDFIDSTEVGTP